MSKYKKLHTSMLAWTKKIQINKKKTKKEQTWTNWPTNQQGIAEMHEWTKKESYDCCD